MARMVVRALICLAAAVVAWLLTEPMMPKVPAGPDWSRAEFVMVVVVLGAIGLAAGFHQGLSKGGQRNMLLGAVLGAVFALVGGLLGYQIGGGLSVALFGPGWTTQGGLGAMVPRTLVGAMMGAFLGAGIGVGQFTFRAVVSGAFGGLIGGGIAGALFDPIGATIGQVVAGGAGNESGSVSRAVLWAMTGFCVGLFTALIESATRQAWLRLQLGRNEGKEWPLDAAQNHIGRDERAHIPLFGDPNVAALHATIIRQGPLYVLHDGGSPMGTGVNGVRIVAPYPLHPGDVVQVGSNNLQFMMKAGAAQRAAEGRVHATPVGPAPVAIGSPAPLQPIVQTGPTPGFQPAPAPQATIVAPVPSTLSLVPISGPLLGQRFAVAAPLEVGREGSGLAVHGDQQASRRHALVSPAPDGLALTDLGSTNGTFLNGQKITNAVAKRGDTVTIGASTFRVE